jgi:hypothetical protein
MSTSRIEPATFRLVVQCFSLQFENSMFQPLRSTHSALPILVCLKSDVSRQTAKYDGHKQYESALIWTKLVFHCPLNKENSVTCRPSLTWKGNSTWFYIPRIAIALYSIVLMVRWYKTRLLYLGHWHRVYQAWKVKDGVILDGRLTTS